jgi:hypothetical protein
MDTGEKFPYFPKNRKKSGPLSGPLFFTDRLFKPDPVLTLFSAHQTNYNYLISLE